MKTKRWLSPILGLCIGLGFFYTIATRVNLGAVWRSLASIDPIWVAAAIGCTILGFTIRAVRWWLMLRASAPHVRFGLCWRIFFASFALNNVFPLRLGDVVRAFGFTDLLDCTAWTIVGTLITERTLDVLVLIGIGAAVLRLLPVAALPPGLKTAMQTLVILAVVLIACVFLFNRPLRTLLQKPRALKFGERFAAAEFIRHRLLDVLTAIARSAHINVLPSLMALSIMGWLCEGTVLVLMMMALRLPVMPAAAFLGFGAGTLATMLPGPPGYFGTFDFFAIQGLTSGGIHAVAATAIALLSHLTIWATVTIIGMSVLIAVPSERRRRIKALQEDLVA